MPDLLNDAIKEAYEYAPGDITYYDTLEIDHQSFVESIKVVKDFKTLTTLQGDFLPVMFDFALPEIEAGTRGEMVVTLRNIPHESRLKIREASTSRDKITVVYRQYIAENANPDVELPVALQVRSIKETTNGLEARTTFPDLVSARFPRRIMTVESLPGCRLWPVGASSGNAIGYGGYIFGGWDGAVALQDCDQYMPDVWTAMTSLLTPTRSNLSASTIGDSGYIFGGSDTSHTKYLNCDEYTPDVWASKTDMPSPARVYFAASTIGDFGYVYGGASIGDLQDCDEYTPDVWASKTDMPSPAREALAASTIGDSGYIYGGWNGAAHLQDCDEYTPDVWVSKTDMLSPARKQFAASTISNSGYIYGGTDIGNYLQDTDEYTPDVWVSKTDMPLPARCRLAALTISSLGCVSGGISSGSIILQDTDEYTPDVWVSKTDMPLPAREMSAASVI